MLNHVPFWILLDLEDPFEPDRAVTTRESGELPGVVAADRSELVIHGLPPASL
jgi:hypothetical protein